MLYQFFPEAFEDTNSGLLELLGGDKEDYEVYAKSVFDNEKRALFIANDVTTKFSRRSPEEFYNIARYINSVVSSRAGNYMVFCPSYAFMRSVYEVFASEFADENSMLFSASFSETAGVVKIFLTPVCASSKLPCTAITWVLFPPVVTICSFCTSLTPSRG